MSTTDTRPVVAHWRHTYLPASETFVHRQIVSHRRYQAIVLAYQLKGHDAFPVGKLFCIDQEKPSHRPVFRLRNLLAGATARTHGYLTQRAQLAGTRLLHAHFGPDGVEAQSVAAALGVPLVVSFYGYDASRLARQAVWRRRYASLFRAVSAVVVEGSHMGRQLIALGCPEFKVQVIHLGVDAEAIPVRELNGRYDGAFNILFCGRFLEKKGLLDAVQAVGLSQKHTRRPLRLQIMGAGPEERRGRALARTLGLEEAVEWLGWEPHAKLYERLGSTDVILQPSCTASNGDNEGGAPTVLIEAQAAGVPVVSTQHGDIPEVVVDGRTGYLVPEHDVEGLGERLAQLAENPTQHQAFGRAAREHICRSYRLDESMRQLEALYDTVCNATEMASSKED